MHPPKRLLLCLVLLFSFSLGSSHTGHAAPPPPDLIRRFEERSGAEPRLAYHAETGMVRFLSAVPDHPLPVEVGFQIGPPSAETTSRRFLGEYGGLFGLSDPASELAASKQKSVAPGRSFVRFQQTYRGIPVLAGELNVQVLDQGYVLSVNGEVLPDLGLDVTPRVEPASARQTALEKVARDYGLDPAQLEASPPELWIYNPALLGGPGPRLTSLVWRMDVTSTGLLPIRELVLVHAQAGFVVLTFNQVDTALDRIVYDNHNDSNLGLPGQSPVRTEGDSPTGLTDADYAYDFAGDTYQYYSDLFGRDSLDDAGMSLVSTTRYCSPYYVCPYANAFWNGTQMVYGDGYASADDVVGHEMTHAVTEHESHLFYYYQSGAINEAYSDIFGELVDQWNGDPDTPWLMGEDLVIGAIRSLSNPPAFGDPDSMTSPNYTCDPNEMDNGGVHQNSGVANKAAYLMAAGGSFNGFDVSALGSEKTARIWYAAQTGFLLSGSDYADLFDALPAACNALMGTHGITPGDCLEVEDAVLAVDMDHQPAACAVKAVSDCGDGQSPTPIWSDDLENPASGNWQEFTLAGFNVFFYPQPFDYTYTTSGVTNILGYDYDEVTDSAIGMADPIAVPDEQRVFLKFNHAYGFDDDTYGTYDGGIVEYNQGSGWLDAGSYIVDNGYNGTISSGYGNPLSGRQAFVRESGGYTTSRLSLASFGGENVRFRFRIGTDESIDDYGWFIDDVSVYTCPGTPQAPAPFGKTSPADEAGEVSTSPTLSWEASSGAAHYEYCYDTSDDAACSGWTSTGTSTQVSLSGLPTSTTYYWHVKAVNLDGITFADGSSSSFWSFTTQANPPPGAFNKNTPANGATGTSLSPTFVWGASAGATGYEYCFDLSDNDSCDTAWASTTSTIASPGTLDPETTYYWQVRAKKGALTTDANGGAWWSFTTRALPGAFDKSGPQDGESGLPVNLDLSWTASLGATSYRYCFDTSDDDACSNWEYASGTQVALSGLSQGTTYSWQVKAVNAVGERFANTSSTSFWSFTTAPAALPPGDFAKLSPGDAAGSLATDLSLSWAPSPGATGYEYCYDLTGDNDCSAWHAGGPATTVHLTKLAPGTTYYWQVRAWSETAGPTYADGGAWWSFSTRDLPVLPNRLFIPAVCR